MATGIRDIKSRRGLQSTIKQVDPDSDLPLLESIKITPRDIRMASKWFKDQVEAFRGIKAQDILWRGDTGTGRLKAQVIPGKMYFFAYDPKWKKELPYYDIFPLIIPFDTDGDSILALNLHYLDYRPRIALLNALIKIGKARILDPNTKIKYTWATVKRFSQLNAAKGCVKRYLATHLKSPFREIKAQHWHTVALLPISRFVKAREKEVWKDTIKRYGR